MGSIAIIFRTTKINKEGKHPLYVRIIKNRKTQFISLGIHLLPEEWDAKKNRVKTKHPNSGRMNSYISQKLSEAENIFLDQQSKDVNITATKIKEKIKGKALGSFSEYMSVYVESLLTNDKIGTHIKAKATQSKINKFTKNKNLQFEDIDVDFLKKFEAYLSSSLDNSVNTIHGTLRIVRRLINSAIREGLMEIEHNPFLRHKLTLEKTTKVYLTESEVGKIRELKLLEGSKMDLHKDAFLFACDAGGIRISDLLQLRWRDFDGTHLTITTQKTKEVVSIPLSNRALGIILKYSATNGVSKNYVFPFLNPEIDYSPLQLNQAISSANAYLNKDLKFIADKAGIEKHISMHSSRHTWATRALRKGMRIEYVSKLMGHASIKTTQVYAKVVNSELDKAMEVFND